jgi:hypothetical protein
LKTILTLWSIIWVEVRQLLPPGLAPHINHTALKAAPLLQAERQALHATAAAIAVAKGDAAGCCC